jgi:putative zinc finger protein
MTCADVRKLLPDLALGDLDAEPAAAVAAHLKECASCRAESGALGRTVGALRAAPPAAASTERRAAAVAAMARAHADLSQKLLTRRPHAWVPLAAAAAFLLAVAGALTVRGPGPVFTVAGTARVLDRETGGWRTSIDGEKISVGDRVVTDLGGRARLAGGATEIVLDHDTWVEIVGPRRVSLDRGRLMASSQSNELVVTDIENNAVRVTGRVEITIREVRGQFGGSIESSGGDKRIPETKEKIEHSLVIRVASGEAALDGAREQRLRAKAGELGKFEAGGKPATEKMADPRVGSWLEDR